MSLPPKKPPITGPKTRPRPKAAPTNPIPFDLFSEVVVSVTYAFAIAVVEPNKPATDRANKTKAKLVAKYKRK